MNYIFSLQIWQLDVKFSKIVPKLWSESVSRAWKHSINTNVWIKTLKTHHIYKNIGQVFFPNSSSETWQESITYNKAVLVYPIYLLLSITQRTIHCMMDMFTQSHWLHKKADNISPNVQTTVCWILTPRMLVGWHMFQRNMVPPSSSLKDLWPA